VRLAESLALDGCRRSPPTRCASGFGAKRCGAPPLLSIGALPRRPGSVSRRTVRGPCNTGLFGPACMTAGLARQTCAVFEVRLVGERQCRVGALGRAPAACRRGGGASTSGAVGVLQRPFQCACRWPSALARRGVRRRSSGLRGRTVPSGAASSAGVRRRIVRADHAGVSGDSCTVVVADGEGGRYFRPGGRSACRGWTGGWAPDRRSAGDGGGDGCRKRAAGHVVSVPDLWASLVRQRGVAGRAGGGAVMAGARRGETKRGRRGDPAGGRAEKGVPLGARRVSRPPTRGERR
jgi:hypothetical protein